MKSSPITKLAAFVGALSLLALPCVQAEEPERPRPLLLEEGGNLNDFDPATMRLNIQGRSYTSTPSPRRSSSFPDRECASCNCPQGS